MRVIAATNRNLEQMVKDGTFRHDLLYRLNVFPVRYPTNSGSAATISSCSPERLPGLWPAAVAVPLHGLPSPIRRNSRATTGLETSAKSGENVIERAFITSKDGRRLNLERALPEDMAPATAAQGRIATRPGGRIVSSPMRKNGSSKKKYSMCPDTNALEDFRLRRGSGTARAQSQHPVVPHEITGD